MKPRHVSDQPAEVLPEEPGDEGQREEDRGQDGQLFDGRVLPHADLGLLDGDHRDVRLQHGGQQVPLGGDLLVHQQQVVVHVVQVGQQVAVTAVRSMVASTASSGCTAR